MLLSKAVLLLAAGTFGGKKMFVNGRIIGSGSNHRAAEETLPQEIIDACPCYLEELPWEAHGDYLACVRGFLKDNASDYSSQEVKQYKKLASTKDCGKPLIPEEGSKGGSEKSSTSASSRSGKKDILVPNPDVQPICREFFQSSSFGQDDPTKFNIDLSFEVFSSDGGLVDADAYLRARDKWMEVIVEDLEPIDSSTLRAGNCKTPLPDVIDDMHICVIEGDLPNDTSSFKGILGFINRLDSRVRDDGVFGSGPTITGEIVFDRDGIRVFKENGIFDDLVKSAVGDLMGPVPFDFLNFSSFPVTYMGENGLDVWQNIWGCDGKPPFGGVNFWQEECLQNELMTTGDLSLEGNPLSALTIGLLEDIGYGVNYDAADEFDGSDTTCCFADATENVAPSKPNKRRLLSDAAKARATEYGLKILRENELPSEEVTKLETEAHDIIYVGDKFITVLIEEDGNVHGVHVTNNKEESKPSNAQTRTLSGASSSAHEDTSTPKSIVLDDSFSVSVPSSMVDESHKKDGGSGSPSRSGKSRNEAIVHSQPTDCTEFFQNADFGENDPTRFNIDIDLELFSIEGEKSFISETLDAYSGARNRWTEVITGDLIPQSTFSLFPTTLPNFIVFPTPPPDIIDDTYIKAIGAEIDGPFGILAFARSLQARQVFDDDSNLVGLQTIAGTTTHDIQDVARMLELGILQDVVTHEIGHIMGVQGPTWRQLNLIDESTFDYIGEKANKVWQTDWGCDGKPPIQSQAREDIDNSSFADHWDEECLQDELMSSEVRDATFLPFSALTIGTLEDIGYEVNYDAADEFDGSDTTCCFADATENVAPSKPNKRRLSDAGKAYATEFGLKILKESQIPVEEVAKLETEASDIIYVGDKFVTVYMYENGNIYDVDVTSEGMDDFIL